MVQPITSFFKKKKKTYTHTPYVKPQCFRDLISQAQSSRASIMYGDRIGTALLLNVARVLAPQTNAVKLWGELCRTPA